MKFNCIKCGKFICNLDMRKTENKEEDPSYCRDCSKKNLEVTRKIFT